VGASARTCTGCGQTFEARRARTRYCSTACARQHQPKRAARAKSKAVTTDTRTRELLAIVTTPRTDPLTLERVEAIDELIGICLQELAAGSGFDPFVMVPVGTTVKS
jgi:hypothetical protein